jgi:hypothetical protein
MRNLSGILLILALLGVFMLPMMAGPASALNRPDTSWEKITGTPRAALPVFLHNPTLTPTQTPTATRTPTVAPPTPTRTGVPGATGLTGRLVFVEPKTRYYTNVEWIKFWEQIYNPTGSPQSYTILGVNVYRQSPSFQNLGFHTSWTGGPDWISAGCWGPNGFTNWNNGHRCAPNQNEGWHQDHIGDASNIEITTPGHYYIEFWACLSSYFQCTTQGQSPTWRKLGDNLHFDADQNPTTAHGVVEPTQMPQTTCFLITDDPENVYLKCDE